MQTIWKYPFQNTFIQTIDMPIGAEVLCIDRQHGNMCIWVKLIPHDKPVPRTFITYGTGHEMMPIKQKYIGTFQVQGGTFIFHVFEALEKVE